MAERVNNRVSLHPLTVTPTAYELCLKHGQPIANNLQDFSPMYSTLNKAECGTSMVTPKNKTSRVKRRLLYEFEVDGETMTVEEINDEQTNGNSDDDLSFNPNFVISSNSDVLNNVNQNYYIPSPPREYMELENANKIKSQERRDMNIQDVEKVQNENEAVNNQICMDSTNIVCASDVSSESASKDQMPSMSVDRHNLKDYVEVDIPEIQKIQYDHAAEEKVLSADGGRKTRRQFCIFCKQLVAKLPNHIEAVHNEEEIVKRLKSYPKGHSDRQEILKSLRRRGAEEYNGNRMYNKGVLIAARRPKAEQKGNTYLPCANCSQLMQARRLHRHYKRCNNLNPAAAVDRHYQALAKKKQANIHVRACEILKNRVMPFMRVDKFSDAIRFDNLAVAYGNSMCYRYATSTHHDIMIRSHLRFLGRLILEARTLNTAVTNLASLMAPAMHNTVVDAIHNIAGFSHLTGNYRAPSTAAMLAMIVKKITYIWETECITANDMASLTMVSNFRTLFTKISYPQINKTVEENRTKLQRRKTVKLPGLQDVNKLARFLKSNCERLIVDVQSSEILHYSKWKDLGAYLMGAIMVLNRRRPGEMQRIEIEDFNAVLEVEKNHPEYEALSEEERKLASAVRLFIIRGKLNRSVQVVLNEWMKDGMDIFLARRTEAGVPNSNPYVFGLPGGGGLRHLYLDIGKYMRIFAEQCGATNPTTLRATILRKHLATKSAAEHNSNEAQIQNLASHLGHADFIHKNIYTQKGINRNLLKVVKLLEHAQGDGTLQDHSTNETSASSNRDETNKHSAQHIINSTSSDQSEDAEVLATSSKCDQKLQEFASSCQKKKTQMLPFVLLEKLSENAQIKSKSKNMAVTATLSTDNQNSKRVKLRTSRKRRLPSSSSSDEPESEDLISDSSSEDNSNMKEFKLRHGTPKKLKICSRQSLQQHQQLDSVMANQCGTPFNRRYNSRDVTTRKRWSPHSLKALESAFSSNILNKSLPSLPEIRMAKLMYPALKLRGTPVIKTAIHNRVRKLLGTNNKTKRNIF